MVSLGSWKSNLLLISLLTTVTAFPASSASHPRRSDLPPPPCPRSNPSDDFYRNIRQSWPVETQNWLCESGILRSIQDNLILVGIPAICKEYPESLIDFFHLSTSSAFLKTTDKETRVHSKLTNISYGSNKMQFIDLIEPTLASANGVVAFVHGGAWGSGRPWMYRLVALPFLKMNKAVAIVGYRTFPDADVHGQVADIGSALNTLALERPDLLEDDGAVEALIGHSSGAHIGLLHILKSAKKSAQQQLKKMTPIKKFYGLSGIYCISSHFEYEKGRGVDQLCPLRIACGPEEKFAENSPIYQLDCIQRGDSDILLDDHFPHLTLIHGIDDNSVQYTQCCNVVDAAHSAMGATACKEELLEGVGHIDTSFHLMVGGVTRDVLCRLIKQ